MHTIWGLLPVAQATAGAESISSLYSEWMEVQQTGAQAGIILIVLGQVIAIIANYLSSKVVVADYHDTFPNALRIWILQWLTTVLAVVSGLVLAAALNAAGSPQLFPVVILGILLMWFVLIIRIPMLVYRVQTFKAIGFLLLAFVFTIAGSVAAQFFVGPSPARVGSLMAKVMQLPPAERASFFALLRTEQEFAARAAQPLNGEMEARDPSKTLEERAQALKNMYVDLETRRRAIRPGDQKAITIYQHQKARYESLLTQLKTEAAQRDNNTARQ